MLPGVTPKCTGLDYGSVSFFISNGINYNIIIPQKNVL